MAFEGYRSALVYFMFSAGIAISVETDIFSHEPKKKLNSVDGKVI